MAEASLYLFDGYNLLRAGDFRNLQELVDRLAGYVALRGAQAVVVFDGVGEATRYGSLEVRFASPADDLLERLAAESRERQRVCIVSSDRAIRRTAGQEVAHLSAKEFLRELHAAEKTRGGAEGRGRSRIEDALDEETRERLERWRRRRR